MYKEGIVFMDYRTILQEENDAVRERLDLSMERVTAMGEEDIRQPYGNYFRCVSRFILMIGELVKERQEGRKLFLTQLQERNHRLYEDILPEFDRMMETEQETPHHMYTVGEHTIHAMMNVRNDKILRLTMLLHDTGKPEYKTMDEDGVRLNACIGK